MELIPVINLKEMKFIKSVGEEYQVVKRGRKYPGSWEEYNMKNRQWGAITYFLIILRLLRRERKFRGRKSRFNNMKKGRISSCRELSTLLVPAS